MKQVNFLVLIILLLFASCTRNVAFKRVKPAMIDIPYNIKRVAVVDRTIPENAGYKVLNVLGGLLSNEGLNTTRDAVPFALRGCNELLGACYRYEASVAPMQLKGTGLSYMGSSLPWDTVGHLCRRLQVQGLLVLEAFDIDYDRVDISDTVKTKNKKGEIEKTITNRTVKKMKAKSGWRFYDPINKIMLDESSVYADNQTEKPYKDGGQLYDTEKRDIAKELAYLTGSQYAKRVTPHWIGESRYFYSKGSDNLKIAARQVEGGDWNAAINVWKDEINNPKKKISSRAYYNMIVANEMLGKTDIAMDWANKSYQKYGKLESKTYIDILRNQMQDDAHVKQQLGEDYKKLVKQK